MVELIFSPKTPFLQNIEPIRFIAARIKHSARWILVPGEIWGRKQPKVFVAIADIFKSLKHDLNRLGKVAPFGWGGGLVFVNIWVPVLLHGGCSGEELGSAPRRLPLWIQWVDLGVIGGAG